MSPVRDRLDDPNGLPVRMDCPGCGAKDVTGSAYDNEERIGIKGLPDQVSTPAWRTSWVVCPNCLRHLKADRPAAELVRLSPAELKQAIKLHQSLIASSLAVLAILFSCLPGVGLLLGLVAVLMNRPSRPWSIVSYIGLGLAVLATGWYGKLMWLP